MILRFNDALFSGKIRIFTQASCYVEKKVVAVTVVTREQPSPMCVISEILLTN